VNKPLRATLIWFLALTLLAIVMGSCATPEEANSSEENAGPASERPASVEPISLASSLLPTLEVAVDSCYVFVKPEGKSPYFGPLLKGEKIKWLDVHGNWVRVWIPRLRVSGWVRGTKVRETNETPSGPETVPEDLLSTVTVITKWANIREGPTTRSRILLTAEKNQQFLLLNQKKGWFQIWLTDLKKKGWISGKIASKKTKK